MALLNQFGPFSNSWLVTVNSKVKHTMHCIGMHDMGMHDAAMHYVAVHDVDVPGICLAWTFIEREPFSAVKKLTFDAQSRGKN